MTKLERDMLIINVEQEINDIERTFELGPLAWPDLIQRVTEPEHLVKTYNFVKQLLIVAKQAVREES